MIYLEQEILNPFFMFGRDRIFVSFITHICIPTTSMQKTSFAEIEKKMLSATSNFSKNITILSSSAQRKPCKHVSSLFSLLPTSNLIFWGKNFPQKNYVSLKNRGWNPYPMKDLIKTRVSRGSSGDEDISALEQEVLIDGSSDFSPNLTANGLESTLNHLVGIIFLLNIC